MTLVEKLKAFKKLVDQAENDIFFRLGDEDEDLIKTNSVEMSEERVGGGSDIMEDCFGIQISEHLIYEMSEAEYQEELQRVKTSYEEYDPRYPDNFSSNLYWDDDGHLGAGLYYVGVCCMASLAGLAYYVNSRSWGNSNSVVFVFEGDNNGDCNDGAVAIPRKKITKIGREILENEILISIIDDICCGYEITVNGEII